MLIIFRHPLFCVTLMALTRDDISRAAHRLHQAENSRTQIRQLSLNYPAITIADAYAIQKARVDIKVAEGRVIKGHKIGLTSKATQSALNIDEPDSGVLFDDMFFADGGVVPSDRFIATRVEAELAFIMSKHLAGPDCTLFDVLNATDFVVPALEILDTRIERVDRETKATRKIYDTIADNAANAGIVLGGRHCVRSMPICAGSARSASRTARSRKPGSLPACSITLRLPWPGSPKRSHHTDWPWNRDRSCWRARSSARSRRARATQFKPTTAHTAL
jgi:2-keto-4-pentenoate hydratase